MSPSIGRPGCRSSGFTLVEVLVALTLVAIALMASLRATAALSANAHELRQRALAQWSAENRLARMRIEREWPALGRRQVDCPQAEVRLTCEEEVFATPNAQFRRVEIRVYPAQGERIRLARLTGFATNQP
ncbi:MAG: type II secretion system minor pseudopilin GspI [Burkholderiales bacterium]